jgi:hypothetical protein
VTLIRGAKVDELKMQRVQVWGEGRGGMEICGELHCTHVRNYHNEIPLHYFMIKTFKKGKCFG